MQHRNETNITHNEFTENVVLACSLTLVARNKGDNRKLCVITGETCNIKENIKWIFDNNNTSMDLAKNC